MIEHAVCGRARTGELSSGDHHVLLNIPGGVLVAVIDAVGHGPEAREVALAAVQSIQLNAEDSLISIARSCDHELRGTRGVVMALCEFNFDDSTMTWLGVGNVQGLVLRAGGEGPLEREYLLQRAGVIGYRLPPLSVAVLTVSAGDTMVLTTDGVLPSFERAVRMEDDPGAIAERIIRDHTKAEDDALAFVAKYCAAGRGT